MIKLPILVLLLLSTLYSVAAQGGKAEPNRIRFAAGESSATLSGTLSNNQEMEYVFGARAGQTVTLKVASKPKGNFFDFDLAGDGFDVETEFDYYSDYSFAATQTGDYLVTVRKRPTADVTRAKFYLTLTIK